MIALTPHLHVHSLGTVNVCFALDDDGWWLIDTGMPGSADAILHAAASLGQQPTGLRGIVLTHHHIDHAGSAADLHARTGAPIHAHPLDAELIRRGIPARETLRGGPGIARRALMALGGGSMPRAYDPAPVAVEVEDDGSVPALGGLRAYHTPGHSAGHLAFLSARENTLIAGDACANLLGLDPSFAHEDFPLARQSLARLATLVFERACFGHGRPIVHDAQARFRRRWA